MEAMVHRAMVQEAVPGPAEPGRTALGTGTGRTQQTRGWFSGEGLSRRWRNGTRQGGKSPRMFGRYKHSGRAELPCPVAKCFKTSGTYYVTITHFPSMCESLAKVGRHGWTLGLLWRHRVDTGMSVCQHHPQRISRDEDSEEEPHGQSLSPSMLGF